MKKFISTLLVLCLICSFIPVIGASAEDAVSAEKSGITVVYNWASQMYDEGAHNKQINNDKDFLSKFTFARSHNLWEYESAQTSWAGTYLDQYGGKCIKFNRSGGNLWMAFEIYVPKTGWYTVEQNYAKISGSESDVAVYMMAKNGDFAIGNRNEENKIFTLDCKGESSSITVAGPATANKYIEAGYYYVLYLQVGGGSAFFGNLTLNGGTDEVDVSDIADYDAPTVDGLDITGKLTAKEYNEETNTFTLTAESEKDGNKFLYWAKGMSNNKKIVSFSNKLENYMPEEDGRNYLIAVYEGDVPEKAEYYNANGQRVATETKPTDYPSMAGYGKAYDWEQYGDTEIYVAKYAIEEPAKNINISVADGDGSGTYAFGDTVTCTATPGADHSFKCWTKTLDDDKTEVVSVDSTYTFNAWEDCTVTAVYEYTYSGSGMKIVIDSFSVTSGVTGIMAEFIGFDSNVVEKGIMFVDEDNNETKIAMTTPGKQFTVIADEVGTYKGYAILKNGSAFTLITDGAYTKEQ